MKTLGSHDICCSGLMPWNERCAADYRAAATVLNQAGRALKEAGIMLHYHHHEFEFERVDGDKQDQTNKDPRESLAISRRYLRDEFGF